MARHKMRSDTGFKIIGAALPGLQEKLIGFFVIACRFGLHSSHTELDDWIIRIHGYLYTQQAHEERRKLAQALRQSLRSDGISITCINPGSICTSLPYEQGRDAVLRRYGKEMLPMHDLVALGRCVRQLSAATQVSEIDVPAMGDVQA